eukprot:297846-Chlamydomonas_euryale.AAC.17
MAVCTAAQVQHVCSRLEMLTVERCGGVYGRRGVGVGVAAWGCGMPCCVAAAGANWEINGASLEGLSGPSQEVKTIE